jgi:NADH dehydrogenase FAD-containing subunit
VGTSKRVVLLGAGHAHLYALKRAREFSRRGYELVVVAPDAFWYSGLATGVLGGNYAPEMDRVDVGALVARGGRFRQDRVLGVDVASRTVQLEASPPLSYDALSITLGSCPPPIPGARETIGCYSVKPVRRLCELRAVLEKRFERRPGRGVRVAVAGGGVTACEVAANIAALAEARGGRADVTVLARSRLLEQLPDRAARRLVRALERRGVRFCSPARVTRVETGCAILEDGRAVGFDLFVNATGLKPSPLVREIGLPVDEEGALIVDHSLRSIADPTVHGGGDCIALRDEKLARIGVYAIREAPVLYHNLLAALGSGEPVHFEPQSRFLWIMNLGDGTGLAARGRLWWHGRLAFRLKDWIDRRFLREYQQAAGVAPPPG